MTVDSSSSPTCRARGMQARLGRESVASRLSLFCADKGSCAMRRTWVLIVPLTVVCLPAVSLLHAAIPLTPAQALSYVRIADLHLSPDGRQLACVAVSYRWDARPHIRLVDVATG